MDYDDYLLTLAETFRFLTLVQILILLIRYFLDSGVSSLNYFLLIFLIFRKISAPETPVFRLGFGFVIFSVSHRFSSTSFSGIESWLFFLAPICLDIWPCRFSSISVFCRVDVSRCFVASFFLDDRACHFVSMSGRVNFYRCFRCQNVLIDSLS